MNLTREQLLAGGRLRTATVDVDGGTVGVRGLTRAEALLVRNAGDTPDAQEPMIVLYGLCDPQLDPAGVKELFDTLSAGDVQALVAAITDLSGMGEGAGKAATKSAARRR